MPEKQQNPQLESISQKPAPVRDKRRLPEGVVPKQAQGYVVAGLAVLILLAVLFSKERARPAAKEPAPSTFADSGSANQQKIEELERDLNADQRQSQSQRASDGQAGRTANNSSALASLAPGTQAGGAASSATQSPVAAEEQRDPIADAERALAFKARFASNLVSSGDVAARAPAGDPQTSPESDPTQAHPSGLPHAAADKRAPEVNVNSAYGQPYVVFEGTTLDTVLVNRLDGEFAGPVKVMVTNPVYSQDRQHLLIPEGSFILGDVQKVSSLGQKRLAVTFHRLLMPDGYSVDLDQFHGLDQAGATGLKDKVNNHYAEIFGASIALGIIAGAAEATNTNQGLNASGSEAYKAGIASSVSQSSANVLDRFTSIQPTITIREGHRIKVYFTQDLLLPAFENHTVPGDI